MNDNVSKMLSLLQSMTINNNSNTKNNDLNDQLLLYERQKQELNIGIIIIIIIVIIISIITIMNL